MSKPIYCLYGVDAGDAEMLRSAFESNGLLVKTVITKSAVVYVQPQNDVQELIFWRGLHCNGFLGNVDRGTLQPQPGSTFV